MTLHDPFMLAQVSLEAFSKLAAIAAVVFGGFKFFIELRAGNRQKLTEFRWKKAQLAREILDEMFKDFHSRSALRMLDWNERDYELPSGDRHSITAQTVLSGLRTENLNFNLKEQFVRDSFERLYDMTDSIEHFIQIGLLEERDVMQPLSYYAACIASQKVVHERFWLAYGYELTHAFFRRFKEFTAPSEFRG